VITKLTIENYRCIRKAEIGFTPLTALVGPNGSGKSTVLSALRTQYRSVADYWRKDPGVVPEVSIERAGAHVSWRPGAAAPPNWCSVELHQLSVDALREANQLTEAHRLDIDGRNLANVFATLTRKEQEQVSKEYCSLVPTFSDLDVRPTRQGFHQIRFEDRWKRGLWYTPHEVSDGSMLMLAFLTMQFGNAPEIVALEEPERGLHPYLMQQLVRFLRSIAHGSIGPKPVQVVLATHSGDLLDHLNPEEVRFLDRDPQDGAVTVHQVDPSKPKWKEAFEEYRSSLRDAWLSGGLGGVP